MKDLSTYASNIADIKELETLLPKYKSEATKALQQANNVEYNGKAKLDSSGYILDDGVLVNGTQSGHIDVQGTVFSGLPEYIQDKIGDIDYYDLLDDAGYDDAIDRMFTNNANILECIYKNPIRINSDDSSTYVSLCDNLTTAQAKTLADWLDLILYSNGSVDISLSDSLTHQIYFSGILSVDNYDTKDIINFIRYTQNNKRPPSTAVIEELRETRKNKIRHFSDSLIEDLDLYEGIWGYQTWTSTGPRNKPIYTLTYGENTVAKYDKNTFDFTLSRDWERHIDKLIEWLAEYYPRFFTKKQTPNSCSFVRFYPTKEEAIAYIKNKRNIDFI